MKLTTLSQGRSVHDIKINFGKAYSLLILMYFVLHGKNTQLEGIYFDDMMPGKAKTQKTNVSDRDSKSENNSSIISNKYGHHRHNKEHRKLALVFRLQYIQRLRKCAKKVMKMTG